MLVLGSAVAIIGSAAVVGLGFTSEQGWLVALGILGLAASLVGGIVKAASTSE